MVFATGLFFIGLLLFLFIILYKSERLLGKNSLSHATIEECWDGRDRRKHVRFNKALDVIYSLEKKPHLNSNIRTLDISEGGAKLVMDKKLSKDVFLNLKLEIPGTMELVEIAGKVAWSEEAKVKDPDGKRLFHTGIQFITLKEPSGKSFINYIRLLADGS